MRAIVLRSAAPEREPLTEAIRPHDRHEQGSKTSPKIPLSQGGIRLGERSGRDLTPRWSLCAETGFETVTDRHRAGLFDLVRPFVRQRNGFQA